MKIRNFLGAAILIIGAPAANAALIVETFESFADGQTITNQLTGLMVTAANSGNAKIATASAPVVPGEPLGIYNDAAGQFSTGFEFPLIFDFTGVGSSIGAIVDFGVVGAGLTLIAYDGAGGTGNVLGTASTTTEQFIGVNAAGIQSAVFQQTNPQVAASWLLDNLTYNTGPSVSVPVPGTIVLLGLGLAGFTAGRNRKST
jgi:hypothetical protein